MNSLSDKNNYDLDKMLALNLNLNPVSSRQSSGSSSNSSSNSNKPIGRQWSSNKEIKACDKELTKALQAWNSQSFGFSLPNELLDIVLEYASHADLSWRIAKAAKAVYDCNFTKREIPGVHNPKRREVRQQWFQKAASNLLKCIIPFVNTKEFRNDPESTLIAATAEDDKCYTTALMRGTKDGRAEYVARRFIAAYILNEAEDKLACIERLRNVFSTYLGREDAPLALKLKNLTHILETGGLVM